MFKLLSTHDLQLIMGTVKGLNAHSRIRLGGRVPTRALALYSTDQNVPGKLEIGHRAKFSLIIPAWGYIKQNCPISLLRFLKCIFHFENYWQLLPPKTLPNYNFYL